jgi:WD40 repeat protein
MKKLIFSALITFCASNLLSAQEVLKTKEAAHGADISVLSVAVSHDGSYVLTGGSDKRIYLWSGKTLEKIKGLAHGDAVKTVAFSSDAKFFASGSADMKAYFFDTKEIKTKKVYKEHTAEVTSVAFSPFNNLLASGSKDNLVKVWDESKTTETYPALKGHTKEVLAVAFSADGKNLASGSADNTVKIWDVSTKQLVTSIDAGTKGVSAVAYSSDGKYLASGGMNGTVVLWDAATGTKIAELADFKSQVSSLFFSGDVQYLFACGKSKELIIWNVESKKLVKKLPAHDAEMTSAAISDDGKMLVTAAADGSLKTWDASSLNIGIKKYPKGTEAPALSASALTMKEDNVNGILEPADNAALTFSVSNKGKGQAFGVRAKIALDNAVSGIAFESEYFVGNIDAGKNANAMIPLTVSPEVESAASSFTVSFTEAGGTSLSPIKLSFQTSGGANTYSYVTVLEHGYSSATGKAETGAPITLKLKLKNVSQGEAKNIKVNYLFPDNVRAVNKLFEMIPAMAPGEMKEISVEFFAAKEFVAPELKIGLNVEGCFTNANDLILKLKMKENLPAYNIEIAQTPPPTPEQPIYRGGGDPLKGLNISKPKEMVIGNYYALIVGIDKYKGHWTPLQNAVRDAKAVEAMLRAKYKFDNFKVLYNEQATRDNIIKEFEWLIANVKEADNVFIYYSGHGEYKNDLNKGFWVPADAETPSVSKYISNSDIQTFLSGIKSKHTLLVSDACFSGDIFRGNTITVPFEESEKYYKEVHNLSSRQAITSGGIEPVMDGGKDGHSVFAYYFLKTLRENESRYLDASQIFTKIKIPVINNSEQSPKFSPIKNTGDEGGQFIFIKKP